jgi:prepilin-type N-terminal cleavage/methylation domain-containing protein
MRHAKKGFTLVELLVVVAIMAVLISILLPAMAKARAAAQVAACLSNLRQIGMAFADYSTSNKFYPALMDATTDTGYSVNAQGRLIYWYNAIIPNSHIQSGRARIMFCPADLYCWQEIATADPIRSGQNKGDGYLDALQKFHVSYGYYNFAFQGWAVGSSDYTQFASRLPDQVERAVFGRTPHPTETILVAEGAIDTATQKQISWGRVRPYNDLPNGYFFPRHRQPPDL